MTWIWKIVSEQAWTSKIVKNWLNNSLQLSCWTKVFRKQTNETLLSLATFILQLGSLQSTFWISGASIFHWYSRRALVLVGTSSILWNRFKSLVTDETLIKWTKWYHILYQGLKMESRFVELQTMFWSDKIAVYMKVNFKIEKMEFEIFERGFSLENFFQVLFWVLNLTVFSNFWQYSIFK